jgi:hypothetical protein
MKTNKNSHIGKHATLIPASEQSLVNANTGRKGFINASKHRLATKSTPTRRATVDDATWDKIVKDLMEEYDEAWTKLADS